MSGDNVNVPDEDGILYGGPDTPLIEADCRSFGEVILRKFAESKDKLLFVSVTRRNDMLRVVFVYVLVFKHNVVLVLMLVFVRLFHQQI